MMFKKLTIILLLCMPVMVHAQETLSVPQHTDSATSATSAESTSSQFGYLSYSEIIQQMPEYISSQQKLEVLQQKYDEELARSDREFNMKFAEFLDGQKDFPENILVKRQKELQNLMEKSIQFKTEIKALLEQARKDLSAPVIEKLDAVIQEVGTENKLDYILNTDNRSYPFINPSKGKDVTRLVKMKLGIPLN